jgi:hypothetical protein
MPEAELDIDTAADAAALHGLVAQLTHPVAPLA